jgi:hypothetical protein
VEECQKRRLVGRPSPALVLACVALAVALSGTSYAAFVLPANSVGAKQLRKSAVTSTKIAKGAVAGAKVKDDSLGGADILESSLGKVPFAAHADIATSATNAAYATSADSARPSGAAGGALSGAYPSPLLVSAEPYHEVGAPGQPPFGSGWHNDNPSTETTAAFYKDPFGVVHLKGVVDGIPPYTPHIFELPSGYRPTNALVLATSASGASAYVFIFGTGDVYLGWGSGSPPATPLLLDGLTFRAGEG